MLVDPNDMPPTGMDSATFANIRAQWDGFMSDPNGRAALLSAGLAMAAPQAWGATPMSSVGAAVGAAGESLRGSEARELKRQEVESKADLREAQAGAATARSQAAATNAQFAEGRLNLARDRLGYERERDQAREEGRNFRAGLRDAAMRDIAQLKAESQAEIREVIEGRRDARHGLSEETKREINKLSQTTRRFIAEESNAVQRERIQQGDRFEQGRNERAGAQRETSERIRYNEAKRKHDESQQSILVDPKDRKPYPSFDDWRRQGGQSQIRSEEDAFNTNIPDAVMGQKDRQKGFWNVPGRGVGYWDGTKWDFSKKP